MKNQETLAKNSMKVMQGNEACAEGALASGCTFFAGYPITPASEIAEQMSIKLPKVNGVFMQMEDELASINALIGARWGGAKAMTATSGAGFSLMQEGLGYGIVSETPMVIVEVQRGGPSTGQPTMSSQSDIYQARYGTHGDYEIIVYAPSSVQEMFDFTIQAFNKSEQFRVPVIVLADEIVAHMREKVTIPSKIDIYTKETPSNKCDFPFRADSKGVPPNLQFFQGHNLLVDGQLHDEKGIRAGHLIDESAKLVKRLNAKIVDNINEIADIEIFETEDAEMIVVAYGSVARSARSTVIKARERGLKVGLIKINTVWPFPEDQLRGLISDSSHIFVPEMNVGKYYREIRGILKAGQKIISIPLLGGELHKPEFILSKIDEVKKNAGSC